MLHDRPPLTPFVFGPYNTESLPSLEDMNDTWEPLPSDEETIYSPEIVEISSIETTPVSEHASDNHLDGTYGLETLSEEGKGDDLTREEAQMLLDFVNSASAQDEPQGAAPVSPPHEKSLTRKLSSSAEPSSRPSKKFRGANLNIEVTRVLKPIQYAPTPVSPYREITFISAERVTSRGREYRVQLREYWVSELDLPDIEEIRRKQIRVYGKPWVVLPPT